MDRTIQGGSGANSEKELDDVSPTADSPGTAKITSGQLEAVALRFRQELNELLQRKGTGATATIRDGVLTIDIAHSLSAAEHNLMRRTSGREFVQHYFEELAEQMYPNFVDHIEHILPVSVTYSAVRVDCDRDRILFSFGIRKNICWTEAFIEGRPYHDYG